MRPSKTLIAFLLLALGSPAWAAIPSTLNYQGRMKLTGTAGTVPDSTGNSVIFRICGDSGCGSVLWTENWNGPSYVSTKNGLFNVELGSITPINLPFDQPYFLEVQWHNGAGYETLSPTQPLTAAPYAFRAKSVDAPLSITGSSAVTTFYSQNTGGGDAGWFQANSTGEALRVLQQGGGAGVSSTVVTISSTDSAAIYGFRGGVTGNTGAGVKGVAGANTFAGGAGVYGVNLSTQPGSAGLRVDSASNLGATITASGANATALYARVSSTAAAGEFVNDGSGPPLKVNSLNFPLSAGTSGQVLSTDGSSQMSWVNAPSPSAPLNLTNSANSDSTLFAYQGAGGHAIYAQNNNVTVATIYAQNLAGGNAVNAQSTGQQSVRAVNTGSGDGVLATVTGGGAPIRGSGNSFGVVGTASSGKAVTADGFTFGLSATASSSSGKAILGRASSTAATAEFLNDGTGSPLKVNALNFPANTGSNGQVLSTDGSSQMSWINAPGVSGPFSVTSTGAGDAIYAENTSTGRAIEARNNSNSPAVYAQNSSNGGNAVEGTLAAAGSTGAAVYGLNVNGSGSSSGLRGNNTGSGFGVFGQASGGTGIYGTTNMPGEYGVHGYSANVGGSGAGIKGTAASTSGYGVLGQANKGVVGEGVAVGVSGTSSAGTLGVGVFGRAGGSSSMGVNGVADDLSSWGVLGLNKATSGAAVGVGGGSDSANGRGVMGQITAGSGNGGGIGVYGTSNQSGGVGVYGDNTNGGAGVAGTGVTGVAGFAQAAGNTALLGNSQGFAGALALRTIGDTRFEGAGNTTTFNTYVSFTAGTNLAMGVPNPLLLITSTAGSNGTIEGHNFGNGPGVRAQTNGSVALVAQSSSYRGAELEGRFIGVSATAVDAGAGIGGIFQGTSGLLARGTQFGISVTAAGTSGFGVFGRVSSSAAAGWFVNDGTGEGLVGQGGQGGPGIKAYSGNGSGPAMHAFNNGGSNGPAFIAEGGYTSVSITTNWGAGTRAILGRSNGGGTPAAEFINDAGGPGLKVNNMTFPSSDSGQAGKVLGTDGSGTLSWVTTGGVAAPLSLSSNSGTVSTLSVQQIGAGNALSITSGGIGAQVDSTSTNNSLPAFLAQKTTGTVPVAIVGSTQSGAPMPGVVAGVYGYVSSTSGGGVIGRNDAATGTGAGVQGYSFSDTGNGVYGGNTVAGNSGAGVYGSNSSGSGTGVFGYAGSATGSPIGVQGSTAASSGTGVRGQSTGVGNTGTGVAGNNNSGTGTAVWGSNTGTTGFGIGVRGDSVSTGAGRGIYGTSTGTNNTGAGVYGYNPSGNGYAVYGQNGATSGSAVAIQGQSGGSTNSVGVLGADTASPTFPGGKIGVYGFQSTGTGVAVFGKNVNTTGSAVGVRGDSSSTGTGIGVYGLSLGANNTGSGVSGENNSPSGIAISAYNGATSGNAVGIFGLSDGSGNGVASVGADTPTPTYPGGRVGVMGYQSGSGIGVYARSGTGVGLRATGATGISATASATGSAIVGYTNSSAPTAEFYNAGTGSALKVNGLNFPSNLGGNGQVLSTNGSNQMSWINAGGGVTTPLSLTGTTGATTLFVTNTAGAQAAAFRGTGVAVSMTSEGSGATTLQVYSSGSGGYRAINAKMGAGGNNGAIGILADSVSNPYVAPGGGMLGFIGMVGSNNASQGVGVIAQALGTGSGSRALIAEGGIYGITVTATADYVGTYGVYSTISATGGSSIVAQNDSLGGIGLKAVAGLVGVSATAFTSTGNGGLFNGGAAGHGVIGAIAGQSATVDGRAGVQAVNSVISATNGQPSIALDIDGAISINTSRVDSIAGTKVITLGVCGGTNPAIQTANGAIASSAIQANSLVFLTPVQLNLTYPITAHVVSVANGNANISVKAIGQGGTCPNLANIVVNYLIINQR